MGCGKKFCCCLIIVITTVVVIVAVLIALFATCVLPGFCLNVSPITKIATTEVPYTGTDNYSVGTGLTYYYLKKSTATHHEYNVY
jgi:hypothetical protein